MTVWVYADLRDTFAELPESLGKTFSSTAQVVARLSLTVRTSSEMAEHVVGTLHSSRELVTQLKTSAQKQAKLLPQHAVAVKRVAAGTHRFARDLDAAAGTLSVRLPTGVRRDGLKLEIEWSYPLGSGVEALTSLSETTDGVDTSLDHASMLVGDDVVRINDSFVATAADTLKVIDDAEKMALVLRSEHLPQTIAALDQAAETLAQASRQIQLASALGISVLVLELLLAATCGTLSFGLLRLAGAMS